MFERNLAYFSFELIQGHSDLRSSVSLFDMFALLYLKERRPYVVVLTYGITSFLDPCKLRSVFLI